MRALRPQQEIGEQRQSEQGQDVGVPSEMRAADSRQKNCIQDHAQKPGDDGGLLVSAQSSGDRDREAGNDQYKLECAQYCQSGRRGKQERQVLRPAFTELGEAAIHAGTDGVPAVAEEYVSARSFYGASQSDILEQAA